jgi:hypothetical protein
MGGRPPHPSVKLGALGGLVVLACATATHYHMPDTVRSYAVLVSGRDSLSLLLARALRRRGLTVLDRARGGGGPTAAMLHFTFRDVLGATGSSLHVQLADTRTGAVVATAVLALDSLPREGASVEAILDSLGF